MIILNIQLTEQIGRQEQHLQVLKMVRHILFLQDIMATETLAASPASTADATTYKNHLVVYKVNTSTSPLAEIYINETSATSDNDINTKILTAKPSKFKAYFTDLAGKTAITYPFTLSTETTLYMSQTAGGGGGGGGRSVSIKLDKDTVSGVVGDKIKVTATVTGSTAKPTWTSSNEDVATVDENGNITFVGKGTATVKVKVNGVVKNIPVTVKEATATPTPVPTVKPTEAPVTTQNIQSHTLQVMMTVHSYQITTSQEANLQL